LIDNVILSHLITNEEYGRRVLPFLKDEYFHENADKVLFQITREYVDTYNAFPTKEALIIEASDKKRSLDENSHKAVLSKINAIKADSMTSMEWLIDQTEKFCQRKALYNGIMHSIKLIDKNADPLYMGEIPTILQDALKISFDTQVGHDFIEDWKVRYELYHKVENKVPFDLAYFNEITGGGFSKKTFNIILGGTGIGKTLVLCHMAAANLMAGKNVLYITLEMAEERIAERIDANLLDVKLDDLTNIPRAIYEKLINGVKSKTVGKLIVKEYATATAGANHFRVLLDELRLKKNFVPDIIYIDYVNLCISSRIKYSASVSSFGYVKAVSEELRGLGVEYDVPIVSASQLNRAGFADSGADMTHVSESFGLPMTADFMVVLITSEELESLNQYMVKQLKNRYRDPTKLRAFVVGVDRSKMRLYDVEKSAQTLSQPILLPKSNSKSKFDKYRDIK
jgi:hypothetical protein